MLTSNEVCSRIKEVDIGLVIKALDRFRFIDSCGECAWVTAPDSETPRAFVLLMNSLGLGGTCRRAFLRKLIPYQNIPVHVDAWVPEGWRRFQVPLVTHPDIVMRWPEDGVTQHLEPGFLWEVRFDRPHEVINPTDHERIHIQIDQEGATI